ncbi:MAG TPA: hypothetical protein ENK52_03195 [Saprospiraceae bacterium]|nr:hypothetical protein [Saprospiraceae bacterium]
MKSQVKNYYSSEKKESLLFIGIGLVALSLAVIGLLYYKTNLWMGISVPLLSVAVIQLFTGLTIFFRTDRQMKILLEQLEKTPQLFKEEETLRLKEINSNFNLYRNVELLVFLLGIFFLLMGGFANWGMMSLGIGIGLSLQMGIMLSLDLFANWRTELYLHEVKKFEA